MRPDLELPPPETFHEDVKARVREAFPRGSAETKMSSSTLVSLFSLVALSFWLFFRVRSAAACALAGAVQAIAGSRLAHEGGHLSTSRSELVNRLALFFGYFLVGPSMAWHYRHVLSHHSCTNEAEADVDVKFLGALDACPPALKLAAAPLVLVAAVLEVGVKTAVDLLLTGAVSPRHPALDPWLGCLLPETALWVGLHLLWGPPLVCYGWAYLAAGAIFVPCSQVAHLVLYPSAERLDPKWGWAQRQVAETCNFAGDSTFWFHLAFGLTLQIEHHLCPNLSGACCRTIRPLVRSACAARESAGPLYRELSAAAALSALGRRVFWGKRLATA